MKAIQHSPAATPTHATRELHRPRLTAQPQAISSRAYWGNQDALRRLSRATPRVQPNLAIGAVNDPLVADADRVAEQAMRMPDPQLSVSSTPSQLNRKCAACEEEDATTLQPDRIGSARVTGGPRVSISPRSGHTAAGTDILDETDDNIPRTDDAGVKNPGPADAGVKNPDAADAGAPAASCCDQAFAKGLQGTDYGGVICCNNVKNTCVWPSNINPVPTNGTALASAITCAREHEDTHHDDVDCTGAAVERPPFKAGKNQRAEECTAYKTEAACLTRHIADCGKDATCKTETTSRRDVKNGQAKDNCG